MTSSTLPTSREVGVYVIYTCLETIVDSTPALIHEFLQHFSHLLSDPQSLEVRITSLRYVGDRYLWFAPGLLSFVQFHGHPWPISGNYE